MTTSLENKWCYSTDVECYTGHFDTESEAHGAAQTAIDDEPYSADDSIVQDYWIARCVHPLDMIKQDIGGDVLELLIEHMPYEVGGDDVPIDMATEDKVELSKLIIDYVRKHAIVQQYGVKDTGKHQYVIGSNAE